MTAHPCPMCGGPPHTDYRPTRPDGRTDVKDMTDQCSRLDHERCDGEMLVWSAHLGARVACPCICHADNTRPKTREVTGL